MNSQSWVWNIRARVQSEHQARGCESSPCGCARRPHAVQGHLPLAPCSVVPPDWGDSLPKWGPAAQPAHRASAAPLSRDRHKLLKLGRRLGQQRGPALAQGCVFCGWHCPGGAAGGALPVHIQPGLKSASPCWRERRACPKRRLLGLPVPPDGCKCRGPVQWAGEWVSPAGSWSLAV